MISYPKILPVDDIRTRLEAIFPEGIDNRNYVIREMAAKTIFVMLYAGAVEGNDLWIRPSQVCTMTNEQAAKIKPQEREEWYKKSLKPGFMIEGAHWYADNTREPIRDETLRYGLIALGAVVERKGLPTTSPTPRFTLNKDFAGLFSPTLKGKKLAEEIAQWQNNYLSKQSLARVLLLRMGTASSSDKVQVTLPNKEVRLLNPGLSSQICKAVIEQFAPRFLVEPALLWLSESGNKVIANDEKLASSLNLHIDPSKNLPDIILVDVGEEFIIVFAEAVATDGPINEQRKKSLKQIAVEAGFDENNVMFMTAFLDRQSPEYKRLGPNLAWGTYVWFMSEPDNIIVLKAGSEKKLVSLRSEV